MVWKDIRVSNEYIFIFRANYSFKYEPKLELFFCESNIYLHICVLPAWDCMQYEIHQEKLCVEML